MLIVPPATALLLTGRLFNMLMLSVILAIFSAFAGHVGALVIPEMLGLRGTVSSGMMAVVAGLLFLIAWVLAPGEGLFFKLRSRDPGREVGSSKLPGQEL